MNDIYKSLAQARKETNKNPTDKQKIAGNYAKGRVVIDGFKIIIENPKGSYRRGKDDNGKEWKTKMHTDYGYFASTTGKDGDEIDVMIGPKLKSYKEIFVVDQYSGKKFDEHKVMLGFISKDEAKKAYLSNYERGWKGFGHITGVSKKAFAKWLKSGTKKGKPFCQYKRIEEMKRMHKNMLSEQVLNNAVNESIDDFLTEVNWGNVGSSVWQGVKNAGSAVGKVANGIGGAVQGVGGAIQGAGDAVAAWGANKRNSGQQGNQQQPQQQGTQQQMQSNSGQQQARGTQQQQSGGQQGDSQKIASAVNDAIQYLQIALQQINQ